MKYILLTLLFLLAFESFSQKNQIENYITDVPDAALKGSVKSIYIKIFYINERNNKIDTTDESYKIIFNKNKTLSKRYDYYYKHENPSQIVKYDKRGRIIQFERKYDDEFYLVKQFFSNKTIFPDSINFYTPNNSKYRQFRYYFKNNQVIKQEQYLKDTLRTFQAYHYDSKKRIIKIYDINTKYGFGTTLDKSFTGTVSKKYLNPNDTIFFKYKRNKDTLITYKYINKKLVEIKKEIKSKKVNISIIEDHNWRYLHSKKVLFKWKDSSNIMNHYYKENGELSWQYSRFISPNYIINNSKHYNDGTDKTTITRFETEMDKCGNWIKKTQYLDGKIKSFTIRSIEYFNNRNCSKN